MLVCAGASVCVCVCLCLCMCMCVCARALRIVSTDKILCFKNTLLLLLGHSISCQKGNALPRMPVTFETRDNFMVYYVTGCREIQKQENQYFVIIK